MSDLIPIWEPATNPVAGRCGRIEPARDPSTDPRFVHLRDFVATPGRGLLGAPLPSPPATSDRTGRIPKNGWGMLGNDRWGNCVLAGEAHYWMGASATDSGQAIGIDEQALITLYRRLSPRDAGLVISDVLSLEQREGILGQLIYGFVSVDVDRRDLIKLAVHEFGGCKLGILLTSATQSQFNRGQPWSVTAPSAVIGRHDIEAMGYDETFLYCVTWGWLVSVSWAWVDRFLEEAWARVSPLWLGLDGVTQTGLDVTALLDALAQLGQGPKPTPPPPIQPPAPTPGGSLIIDPVAKTVSLPPGWKLK